jgi:hypothetical protein
MAAYEEGQGLHTCHNLSDPHKEYTLAVGRSAHSPVIHQGVK